MRKRKWIVFVMLLVLFICAACDGSDASAETEAVKPENETAEQIKTEQVKTETGEEIELVIFYSNKSADGLDTEKITAAEITPEIILSNLAKHNIVSIDTKVIGFDILEEDGREIITLDVSKAFSEYIKTMGSGGEAVIIAALTDTFLTAYEADALKLSVEGKVLETGHGIYDKELTYIDMNLGKENE